MSSTTTYAGVVVSEVNDSVDNEKNIISTKTINDTELSYDGEWRHDRLTARQFGYFNNTLSATDKIGAALAYTFENCNEVNLFGPPAKGIVAVSIDGEAAVTVNCESGGCLYKSGALKEGKHKIELKLVEGEVNIDRLEWSGTDSKTRFVNNDNGAFFYESAGFTRKPNDDATSGKLLCTELEDERIEIYFSGSFVKLFGEKSPEYSSFKLSLDSGEFQTISCHSDKREITELWRAENLDDGEFHVIRIETVGACAFDGVLIENTQPLMNIMNSRTDSDLEAMRLHERSFIPQEEWNPVTPVTHLPQNGVKLIDGVLYKAFHRNITYLLDSLKLPYWVNGKDQDRIWVDMLVASNEGRMLGGMGHTLRFFDVPEFRLAISDMLEIIERRQFMNGNGYIMPYQSANYAISPYTWPGIMRDEQKNYDRSMFTKGMLGVAEAGYTEAYDMLRRFYDWYNNADDYLPVMLLGSMGIQGSVAGPLVYHSPVGKPEDIITNMKYYDMDWWLELLGKGYPEAAWRFTLNRPHNYLLTSIRALFLIYIATGEEKYLNACQGSWTIYHDYFQLPGGGITLCEHQECRPWSYKLNNAPVSVFETCGNIFWIDLNSHLLSLDPTNEKYAAEIEESLFNFVVASQGEDGQISYFNHLNGKIDPPGRWNTCCEIQATHFFGALPQYVFSLSDKAVYVNIYASAEINHKIGGKDITVKMISDYPYSSKVSVSVECEKGVEFDLNLRVPKWVIGDVDFTIGGEKIGTCKAGEYFTISRIWNGGETVAFELPAELHFEKYKGEHRVDGAERYMLMYGPITMGLFGPLSEDVYQAPNEQTIMLDFTKDSLLDRLEEKENLVFEVTGTPYSYRPYFTAVTDETFSCFPAFKK